MNTGGKPRGIAAAPDGRRLYVSDQPSGSLVVVDLAAREVSERIAVGKSPEGVGISRDGTWIGSSGWPDRSKPPASIGGMISASAVGEPRRDVAEVGGQLFLVVSEPARFAEETLGTLIVGYALDDAVVRRLAQVTHCDVTIVVGNHLSAAA